MSSWRPLYVTPCLVLSLAARVAGAPPSFEVAFDASLRAQPATGRLVVYLIAPGSSLPRAAHPASGPFFEDPQPMFGIDVRDLAPGAAAPVDDRATSFPVAPSRLPPGEYRAQAVLDMRRDDSNWRREPGNLYSDPVTVTIAAEMNAPIRLTLSKAVEPPAVSRVPGIGGDERSLGDGGAEVFEIRSELLSRFHGRDVFLRAGVITPSQPGPAGANPARRYPAVYVIPGFGGDHRDALGVAHLRREGRMLSPAALELSRRAFEIHLGPESGNGHTLFADSDNNGPVGEALVKELIPALEAKYPLIAGPDARFVTGHSSGGWSALWLQLNYPDTFGGCWASSPDPVDFRRFQLIDLYGDENFYRRNGAPSDTASYRSAGECRMTIRQENQMEEVLGPGNTSGQQWDSWLAAFGPREDAPGGGGRPAALFDPVTGTINRAIAEKFRRYDIADRLRREPKKYGPIFREKIRLVVGGEDNYYLNEAVALLQESLNEAFPQVALDVPPGYIRIVPGLSHESIFRSSERRAFPGEMVEAFRRAGHIPPPPPAGDAAAPGAADPHRGLVMPRAPGGAPGENPPAAPGAVP